MRIAKILLVSAAALVSISGANAQTKMAYYTYSTPDASLQSHTPKLRKLAADLFAMNANGAITGTMPQKVQTAASANAVDLYPVISNWGTTGYDPAIAHAILTQAGPRSTAITNMVNLALQSGNAGINLDFEAVTNTDRAVLSSFIQDLGRALHDRSKRLIVSVPAALSDDPQHTWTGAFDYGVIAGAADLVQIMTYDQNGPWSNDGPVAGLNWVKAVMTYAKTKMTVAKISFGIPAYGYDWNLTDGTGTQVDFKAVPGLIASLGAVPEWDNASSSPKFYYQKNGKEHVVWYENARSVKLKAEYAKAQGFAGVSVWSLGQEDNEFWKALADGGL